MLPKVAVIKISDAGKTPLPRYEDGIGTSMILHATNVEAVKIAPQHFEIIRTGIAIALPLGMEAQVRSLKDSAETGGIVINAPLTIDASDRKEIKVCLYNISQESIIINQGDPVAILVFTPALRIEWMDMTRKIEVIIKEKQTKNQQQEEKEEIIQTPKEEKNQLSDKQSSTFFQEPTEEKETLKEPIQEEQENIVEKNADTPQEIAVATNADTETEESEKLPTMEEFEPIEISEPANEADESPSTPIDDKSEEILSTPTDDKADESPSIPTDDKSGEILSTPTDDKPEESPSIPTDDKSGEILSTPTDDKPEESPSIPIDDKPEENKEELIVEQQDNTNPLPAEVSYPDILTEQVAEDEQKPLVEPPAILAEFEKMENDFYNNMPDPPSIPDILDTPQQTEEEKKDDSNA